MIQILLNSKTIIIKQLSDVYPILLISLPLIILIRITVLRFNNKKGIKLNLWHEAGFLLFSFFTILILSSTVFPSITITENGISTNAFTDMWKTNLIPGRIIITSISSKKNFESYYSTYNFLGNIAIFIPIGFFIPLLWRKINFPLSILCGFIFSVLIELTQLFLPRFTDIDDIILNTFGTILGAIMYFILNLIAPKFTNKFKYQ